MRPPVDVVQPVSPPQLHEGREAGRRSTSSSKGSSSTCRRCVACVLFASSPSVHLSQEVTRLINDVTSCGALAAPSFSSCGFEVKLLDDLISYDNSPHLNPHPARSVRRFVLMKVVWPPEDLQIETRPWKSGETYCSFLNVRNRPRTGGSMFSGPGSASETGSDAVLSSNRNKLFLIS